MGASSSTKKKAEAQALEAKRSIAAELERASRRLFITSLDGNSRYTEDFYFLRHLKLIYDQNNEDLSAEYRKDTLWSLSNCLSTLRDLALAANIPLSDFPTEFVADPIVNFEDKFKFKQSLELIRRGWAREEINQLFLENEWMFPFHFRFCLDVGLNYLDSKEPIPNNIALNMAIMKTGVYKFLFERNSDLWGVFSFQSTRNHEAQRRAAIFEAVASSTHAIFFVNLHVFDWPLLEDPSISRIKDALDHFREHIRFKVYHRDTKFILVFTHLDGFKSKLENYSSLFKFDPKYVPFVPLTLPDFSAASVLEYIKGEFQKTFDTELGSDSSRRPLEICVANLEDSNDIERILDHIKL